MATYNSYTAYKRDTKHLLHWIIQSSNTIISVGSAKFDESDEPKTPNTTGQTTVAALVSMARLIAKYAASPTPESIYTLLQSIIEARTTAWEAYQQTSAANPDPELAAYNNSHKHFIDSLHQIFAILGGKAWESNQKDDKSSSMPDDLDELLFKNKFEVLGFTDSKDGEEGEEVSHGSDNEDTDRNLHHTPPTRRRQPRPGRGKMGKSKKKGKRMKQASMQPEKPRLNEIPLESYKIIEDKEGNITDYLLAVYALAKEWMDMRAFLQSLWKEVAYEGLNSAIAGTVSMLGVAMIQRAEFVMLQDFPGHDAYETVVNTITRGDPEKFQGNFVVNLMPVGPEGQMGHSIRETELDLKENLLLHTHRALLDFIVDFKKTRSGAPTRAMLKEIRNWDPLFDLQKATEAQRLAWRRSFTINWLYDLVNVFSAIVVQRNTMKGQHWAYETVDWSPNGPWHKHRRLFGLNEFAGVITSLAMQKPTTDVRNKIYPHHVFQLQCIVDSLTVSRGWYISPLRGHVLTIPAREFRPRRDVDLFLDREVKNTGKGYLQGVDVLGQLFERDAQLHGDPDRHTADFEVLKEIQADFIDWLGESKYKYGLTTIPPSRFTNTNSNGLWEYSPYLCGVGLMEGLELAYRSSLATWDRIPEALLCVHLHNMLVQKGYIKKPVGLYASLESLFPSDIFANGEVPTANFSQALSARLGETFNRGNERRTARAKRQAARAHDVHDIFNMDNNYFFKTKSNLLLYRQAYWNPDRIPDSELPPASFLGLVRIAQTKQSIDTATGKMRLEDTDLVKRAKEKGMSDEELLQVTSRLAKIGSADEEILSAGRQMSLPEGFSFMPQSEFLNRVPSTNAGANPEAARLTNTDLLEFIKQDISGDVGGHIPFSGVNYLWVSVAFYMFFMTLEKELRETRNPIWVRAYETDQTWASSKRVGLTFLAMAEEDDECLRVMAKAFQNPRTGIMNHIYWEDLNIFPNMKKTGHGAGREPEPDCTVM